MLYLIYFLACQMTGRDGRASPALQGFFELTHPSAAKLQHLSMPNLVHLLQLAGEQLGSIRGGVIDVKGAANTASPETEWGSEQDDPLENCPKSRLAPVHLSAGATPWNGWLLRSCGQTSSAH